MRNTVLALTTGLALFALTSEPVVAETCTGYYNYCRKTLCSGAQRVSLCYSECSKYRRQCMKTGKWISNRIRDSKVQKR